MKLGEYLDDAERSGRRFSGAYTGTSGTLAGHVVRLVKIVRHLLEGEGAMEQAGNLPESIGVTGDFQTAKPEPRVRARSVYSASSHALGDEMYADRLPPFRMTGPPNYSFDTPLNSAASAPAPAAPTENPKDLIGSDKLPLHLWPAVATAEGCIALHNGALKYGRANWRASPVRATVYASALARHMAAWLEGEDVDEEGVPHIGSALACLAILADARAAGTLIDDRNFSGQGAVERMRELTPSVAALRERHVTPTPPRDWTIRDGGGATGTKVH